VDFDSEQAAELAVKALKAEGHQAQMARVGLHHNLYDADVEELSVVMTVENPVEVDTCSFEGVK